MPKLIIHVGPGKCGSSSVQGFFLNTKMPCVQKTNFILLTPSDVLALDGESAHKLECELFFNSLLDQLLGYDVLILSHEMLFMHVDAINCICGMAQKLVSSIVVIGYSRPQSEFIISAYSQWLFRSQERVREVANVLMLHNLDPILFTGVERQMIASIITDFYSARQLSGHMTLDWFGSYEAIDQRLDNNLVSITVGQLPSSNSNTSLIQDFCDRTYLTLSNKYMLVSERIANTAFSPEVVEAINNATLFNLEGPGPHEKNDEIAKLSSVVGFKPTNNSSFVKNMKSYIDTYYLESNFKLSNKYSLDNDYYYPDTYIDKAQIMETIICQAKLRASNQSALISKYRLLSARMVAACIETEGK